jgi:hypothetical protein
VIWLSWIPTWLVLRLLLGTHVEAEATASTMRSEGLARAEASYECVARMTAACAERRLERDDDPGVADACSTDEDGLATCVVVCWGDCATPAEP